MTTRICRNCGTELELGSGDEVCPHCQTPANDSQPTGGPALGPFSAESGKAEPTIDCRRIAAWATRNQGAAGLVVGILFGLAVVLLWWLWAITPGPPPTSADSSRPRTGQNEKVRDFSGANYNGLIEQVLSDTNTLDAPGYLKTLDAAINLSPSEFALWRAKAIVLARMARPEDALAVLTKAVDLAKASEHVTSETRIKLLLERSSVLQQLGREREANKDYAEAGRIQCDQSFIAFREAQTRSELLDLSPFYTSELGILLGSPQDPEIGKAVAAEVLKNTGVEFDLRGLMRVDRQVDPSIGVARAKPVTGIPVHKLLTGLHILHATVDRMPDGMRLGSYLLHFADGQSKDIPIICGKNIQDHLHPQTPANASVAWTDKTNSSTKGRVMVSRFFETAWYNPRPEVALKTVDFVPRSDLRSYFLIALTAETNMSPESLLARIQDAEERGDSAAALNILDKALEQFPGSPVLWNAKGRYLERSRRTNEALETFSKAIDLAEKDTNALKAVLPEALRNRADVFRRLGRMPEAGVDACRSRQIPLRDPKDGPALLDLSYFYNSTLYWQATLNNQSRIREEVANKTGITFDVRAMIRLAGMGPIREGQRPLPQACTNIDVNSPCKKLHFFHGTIYTDVVGKKIGMYILHYDDGSSNTIPIIYGEDVFSCEVTTPLRPPNRARIAMTPTRAGGAASSDGALSDVKEVRSELAWIGNDPRYKTFRLYKMTVPNPRPGRPIKSLDFISPVANASPFLIAITVE